MSQNSEFHFHFKFILYIQILRSIAVTQWGCSVQKENVKNDSITTKIVDEVSNNNIVEDKNTSKIKKDLDGEINNIFN